MPTTSNFGWNTPADTDLVKDGALAIRTLGNNIDTSLVDLKGGTTGQILAKNSNTDLDYTWINNDQGDITAVNVSSPITGGGTTGAVTISIQDATTTQKGAVQLTDSISSTSTTTASTPNSVKSAYDLANAAIPKSLVDAAGDIIYATANDTPARLALGTAGQLLRVNSGATAPEWATVSSGALTKISTNTFSGVAGVNIDDCFTSTYTDYLVIINNINAATSADDILLQLRYGSTTQTADYYGASYLVPYTGSNSTLQQNAVASFTLAQNIGTGGFASTGQIFISRAGNTSERTSWRGQLFDDGEAVASHFAGKVNTARTYTGLRFTAASSNITGTITIYGLAK